MVVVAECLERQFKEGMMREIRSRKRNLAMIMREVKDDGVENKARNGG